MEEKQKAYAYWLNSIPGLGIKSIRRLTARCGSPEEIYKGGEKLYRDVFAEKQAEDMVSFTSVWDVEGEYDRLLESGVNFTTVEEPEYPGRLREIPDPPYGLFWKGTLPDHRRLAAAVVGARDCSEYGRYVAGELGAALGRNGVQLISGMAKGIDSISQRAALEAEGTSFAVLGCGVDICYPAQNRSLYDDLLEKGGVLSSYPPGTQPQPNLFPPRNRIVSGLADAVVVVEARQRSGTLITVDMALEQGREVYAVPGRLTDRLSDGCNRLLKQGAGVLLSPKDFITELHEMFPWKVPQKTAQITSGKTLQDIPPKKSGRNSACGEQEDSSNLLDADILSVAGLSDLEQQVWPYLDFYPQSVEQIRGRLPFEIGYPQMLQSLMKLCLAGAAKQVGAGYFQKKVP